MLEKTITFDKFVRGMLTMLLVCAVLYIMNYLSGVLLPFFIAWLMAYMLYPIVKFIQYKLHLHSRVLSIILTLVLVSGAIGGLLYLIIPPMFEQFVKLEHIITTYLQHGSHANNIPANIQEWMRENLGNVQIQKFIDKKEMAELLKKAVPGVFSVLSQTISVIVSIIASFITLLYMFFMLMDYEYISTNWIKIFPKKNRPFWQSLMEDVESSLNNYIRGQSLVALCLGIMFCIGFTIIDFPMAIGLGILIGIMDLVPYLHTLGLIPTVFLALLKSADTGQNFWVILASALAVFIIVQIITDMVVTPKIMGKAMGLNPAILLLSLSVWGALLGFIGVIIALPLTTLLMAYYKKYVTKDVELEKKEQKNSQ